MEKALAVTACAGAAIWCGASLYHLVLEARRETTERYDHQKAQAEEWDEDALKRAFSFFDGTTHPLRASIAHLKLPPADANGYITAAELHHALHDLSFDSDLASQTIDAMIDSADKLCPDGRISHDEFMQLVTQSVGDGAAVWQPVLLRALWKLTKRRDLGDPWAKHKLENFAERRATRRRLDPETMEWLTDTVSLLHGMQFAPS